MNQIKDIKPKVSVVMITYNHEAFIAEAIEGVLMQVADFPIEFIIADDCSTDGTHEIVQDLINNHPKAKRVNFTRHSNNMGIMPNFIWALQQVNGKYIALCEGDDYWTDPLKLQKQVDILEQNNNYSASSHLTKVIYENSSRPDHLHRKHKKNVLTIKDVSGSMPFHTSSIVFRQKLLKNLTFPDGVTSGDKVLTLYLAMCGSIFMFNDVMSVYRKNEGGISQNLKPESFISDIRIAKWAQSINDDFPFKDYKSYLHYTMIAYPKKYSLTFFIKNYMRYVYYSLWASPGNIRVIWRNKLLSRVLKQKKIDKIL